MILKFFKFDWVRLIFRSHSVGMSSARHRPEEGFYGELFTSDEEEEDSFDWGEILQIDSTWEEDR